MNGAQEVAAACANARPLVESNLEVFAWIMLALAFVAAVTAYRERRRDLRHFMDQARPIEDDRSSLVRHQRHLDAQRVRRP